MHSIKNTNKKTLTSHHINYNIKERKIIKNKKHMVKKNQKPQISFYQHI